MKWLWGLLFLVACTTDPVARGELVVAPAQILDGVLLVQTAKPFDVRLTLADTSKVSNVVINLTRGGRSFLERPLKRDGDAWVANLGALPFAGRHIVTLRVYKERVVWTSALDMESVATPQNQTAQQPLGFLVSEGKPGGDTNGWWGVAAMMVLFVGVFVGVLYRRKPQKGRA